MHFGGLLGEKYVPPSVKHVEEEARSVRELHKPGKKFERKRWEGHAGTGRRQLLMSIYEGMLPKLPEKLELTDAEKKTQNEVWLKRTEEWQKSGKVLTDYPEVIKQKLRLKEKFLRFKSKQLYQIYRQDVRLLRKRIPLALKGKARIQARNRLEQIKGKEGLTPQRFERLGHALRELGRKNMFVENEALFASSYLYIQKVVKIMKRGAHLELSDFVRQLVGKVVPSPAEQAIMFDYYAKANAGRGMKDFERQVYYNCRIFFDRNSLKLHPWSDPGSESELWRTIKATDHNPVLGIQVFDPDPKKLLEVAQVIAKKMPNHPIPIIDLYGNVFYP